MTRRNRNREVEIVGESFKRICPHLLPITCVIRGRHVVGTLASADTLEERDEENRILCDEKPGDTWCSDGRVDVLSERRLESQKEKEKKKESYKEEQNK